MYLDEGVAEEGVLAREVLKVPAVAGDARQAEARTQLGEGDSIMRSPQGHHQEVTSWW